MREEGERKGDQWVDQAVLLASLSKQGQAFLEQRESQRNVASRRGEQPQAIED